MTPCVKANIAEIGVNFVQEWLSKATPSVTGLFYANSFNRLNPDKGVKAIHGQSHK